MKKHHTPKPSLREYSEALENFGYLIGLSNDGDYVIVNGEPLDQFVFSKIYCRMYDVGFRDKNRLVWVLNILAGESIRESLERKIEDLSLMGRLPELSAYETETGNLVAWCDWCMRWHHHGGSEGGARLPHCEDQRSPYYKSEYNLVYAGLLTDKVKKSRKNRKTRHCCRCGNPIPPVYPHTRVCYQCGAG